MNGRQARVISTEPALIVQMRDTNLLHEIAQAVVGARAAGNGGLRGHHIGHARNRRQRGWQRGQSGSDGTLGRPPCSAKWADCP